MCNINCLVIKWSSEKSLIKSLFYKKKVKMQYSCTSWYIMGKLKRTAVWCLSLLYKCVLITTRKLIIITIYHMNLSLYGTLFLTALWQHYRQSSELRQKNSLSSNKHVLHCEGEKFKRVMNTYFWAEDAGNTATLKGINQKKKQTSLS